MAKATRRQWTRSEQIVALELYLRTPFGRIHHNNPDIVKLSKTIGRTPSALSLKMANFAALDPTIEQKGMQNYSRSDAEIWEEFFASPAHFISQFSDKLGPHNIQYDQPNSNDFNYEVREGIDKTVQSKFRQNQDYFRKMLLVSYGAKCAATEIAQPDLLIASHIVPWSANKAARLHPRNGILLNALHDRAFDKGYITLSDDLDIIVSKHFSMSDMAKPFFSSSKISKPERFAPDPAFLQIHRDSVFEKFLK